MEKEYMATKGAINKTCPNQTLKDTSKLDTLNYKIVCLLVIRKVPERYQEKISITNHYSTNNYILIDKMANSLLELPKSTFNRLVISKVADLRKFKLEANNNVLV